MTQDQQKQPKSKRSTPQTPPTSFAAERTRNQKKPFLKGQTIKALRATIGLLEGVVEKLEAEPAREIPPSASPATITVSEPISDTPTATPEPELESSASASIVAETPTVTPELGFPETPTVMPESVISQTPTVAPEPVESEAPSVTPESVVSETPTVTPEPVESNTPTVASEPLEFETPTVMPEIVTEQPTIERHPEPTKLLDRILPTFDKLQAFWDATLTKVRSLLPAAWNAKLSDWALTGAIAGIVVVILVTTAALLPDTPTQVAKAPPNTIEAPPELKAPEPPQPVEIEPPPTPELTPEQSLIAAIQQQVADLTERYGKGLIQSVDANFLSSRLIVKLSDGWYTLKESQQNKLADEILRRSRDLDFSKLEITDLKGTLLARNPVVGSNMVILKRQELAATL
jgi:hypothetical protein